MSKRNHKLNRGMRGSTIVEFAVVFLILFAFMLGIIDFSRAMYAYHGISNAAREASRFASIRGHASCTTTPRTFPTANCPLTTTDISSFVSAQLTTAGIYNNVVTTPAAARRRFRHHQLVRQTGRRHHHLPHRDCPHRAGSRLPGLRRTPATNSASACLSGPPTKPPRLHWSPCPPPPSVVISQ